MQQTTGIAARRPTPTVRERLLGGFVVFQMIAIPLGSYIKLIPVRYPEHHGELNGELQTHLPPEAKVSEPTQSIKDATAYVMSRWGEVSGQAQCWALFATFGVQAAMPMVELNWPNGETVTLRSYFDPADATNYFYPPEPSCRLFNYEYRTVIYYWASRPGDYTGNPEKYRKESMECVRDQRRSTAAYLRWKVAKYLQQHPDKPIPESVVLKAHILPTPPAGSPYYARSADYVVPVARWTTSADELTVWDPVAKNFVALETP